jgi:hypothetical protein
LYDQKDFHIKRGVQIIVMSSDNSNYVTYSGYNGNGATTHSDHGNLGGPNTTMNNLATTIFPQTQAVAFQQQSSAATVIPQAQPLGAISIYELLSRGRSGDVKRVAELMEKHEAALHNLMEETKNQELLQSALSEVNKHLGEINEKMLEYQAEITGLLSGQLTVQVSEEPDQPRPANTIPTSSLVVAAPNNQNVQPQFNRNTSLTGTAAKNPDVQQILAKLKGPWNASV